MIAEQNILTGDQAVLEQIIGDLKEHNDQKERLVKVCDSAKDAARNLETVEKALKDEIDRRIKESTTAICEGYNTSITGYNDKIKEAQVDRDKAKMAGVKERIFKETASLRQENEQRRKQIKESFQNEKIPMYCNSHLYLALFQTRGIVDSLICLFVLALFYLMIPLGLVLAISNIPTWGLIVYYFLAVTIFWTIYRVILRKTLLHHEDVIETARKQKYEIKNNHKKMKRIEKNIRLDKNEDMYNLEYYDKKIQQLNQEIDKIQRQKEAAMENFDKTIKTDLIAEIDKQYREKIDAMKYEFQKKTEDSEKLESLINDQRIYISLNYEAYLGKEFVNLDRLHELGTIMKSGAAQTIAQAISIYKEK